MGVENKWWTFPPVLIKTLFTGPRLKNPHNCCSYVVCIGDIHWCVAYILYYKGIFSIDAQYDPNSFYFVTQMQKPGQVGAWSLAK
jgi:hypothetical protein